MRKVSAKEGKQCWKFQPLYLFPAQYTRAAQKIISYIEGVVRLEKGE